MPHNLRRTGHSPAAERAVLQSDLIEFKPFPKIGRWSRPAIVTEKLDGTNAAVGVVEMSHPGKLWPDKSNDDAILNDDGYTIRGWRMGQAICVCVVTDPSYVGLDYYNRTHYLVYAQSRKRIITPEDDNFEFATWVFENASDLALLGTGLHFGEWWGSGINRGYGLDEKRFSLFNVHRWRDIRPACCHVVPTLGQGDAALSVDFAMDWLSEYGSVAAPGYDRPEGVVVYHTTNGALFKKTFDGDDQSKYERVALVH